MGKCTCACGMCKWEVNHAPVKVNAYCHCKSRSRARGASPVHLILVPREKVVITEGKDFFAEKKTNDSALVQVQCSSCSGGLYQYREGTLFCALLPTTSKIEQGEKGCLLPKEYLPKLHVNYENRMMDSADNLPKFLVKPGPGGVKVNNDGTPFEPKPQSKCLCL